MELYDVRIRWRVVDPVPVGVALAMGVATLIALCLGDLKMLDYDQVYHAIEEGYIATRNKVNDIRMLMKNHETEEEGTKTGSSI